jgi:hypothetical protein
MANRSHKPTSKAGEEFIRVYKQSHKEKILSALEKLKVGGTYEEISKVSGMREDQVWKRLSELSADEKIFDTGITRRLKSRLQGTVWQLKGLTVKEGQVPIIEVERKLKKQPAHINQEPLKL